MNISPDLRKRVLTGVLGGLSLLALIVFARKMGIFLFVSVLSVGMIYEFTAMTFTLPDKIEKRYVLLSVSWLISLFSFLTSPLDFAILVPVFMGLFIYFLLTAKRFGSHEFGIHFRELVLSVFGLIYLVFLPQYLLKIADLPNGINWTVLFFIVVWSGDTGAYFAGLKFGKKKLYPEISPKKTVEGLVGGLITSFVFTLVYRFLFFKNMPIVGVIFIPVLVGLVAQVGDLCESFLKRAFQKKDSGAILPGHGGLLDRFDAVIFSLPMMYACVKILS